MTEDKSQKTEKPTEKKLRDARKRGQIAQSKEVTSTAILIFIFGYFWLTWEFQLESIQRLLLIPADYYDLPFRDALDLTAEVLLWQFLLITTPFVTIGFVTAIVAALMQFGLVFSTEPIKPNFSKVNPVQGAKKIFSTKSLIELLKSVVKIVILSALLYLLLTSSLKDLVKIPYCDINCLLMVNNDLLFKFVALLIPVLIVISGVDFALQKAQFVKDQMMSKEEVKRELKEMEGDPLIKGQRRQLQRELVEEDVRSIIKEATVVVATGGHIAVALWYAQQETTPLPVITMFGRGRLAKHIVKAAHSAEKPIVDDPALARALIDTGRIHSPIPTELIDDVARVLRRVM